MFPSNFLTNAILFVGMELESQRADATIGAVNILTAMLTDLTKLAAFIDICK